DNLRRHDVLMLTGVQIDRIDERAVHYLTQDSDQLNVAADSVVLAIGAGPNPGLAEELAGSGLPIHRLGDSHELRYIEGALRSATEVALALCARLVAVNRRPAGRDSVRGRGSHRLGWGFVAVGPRSDRRRPAAACGHGLSISSA